MSFKPYTGKIKKKKIGICSILGRIRIRIWIQNRTRIRINMIRIRNTVLHILLIESDMIKVRNRNLLYVC